MTLRYLALGGATALALGALSLTAVSATAAAPAAPATATARPTTPVTNVANAATTLKNLRVENTQGQLVGTVADVVTRSDGKALALTVDAGPYLGVKRHLVGIQANQVGYDATRRVLVTNMTKAEVKALPSFS